MASKGSKSKSNDTAVYPAATLSLLLPVCVCVRMCGCTCMRVCIHACVYVCVHTSNQLKINHATISFYSAVI